MTPWSWRKLLCKLNNYLLMVPGCLVFVGFSCVALLEGDRHVNLVTRLWGCDWDLTRTFNVICVTERAVMLCPQLSKLWNRSFISSVAFQVLKASSLHQCKKVTSWHLDMHATYRRQLLHEKSGGKGKIGAPSANNGARSEKILFTSPLGLVF